MSFLNNLIRFFSGEASAKESLIELRKKLHYHKQVHIDPNFSEIEKDIIRKALQAWSDSSGNFVNWDYQAWHDDYNCYWSETTEIPKEEEVKHLMIVRGLIEHDLVKETEKRFGNALWGFAARPDNAIEYIVIVADRIPDINDYRLTVLHEIGHVLGMKHNDVVSIMNSSGNDGFRKANGIVEYDLHELYRIYLNATD